MNELSEHKTRKANFLQEAKRELEKLRVAIILTLQSDIKHVKETKEEELLAIKTEGEQLTKEHDEEHKRNLEKLEGERKKKADELAALMALSKLEEEKNRGALGTQIRQQFNDKIVDYDTAMETKTKEKEEQRVSG